MDLNSLIFPAPKPNYTKNHQDLIYIPKIQYKYQNQTKKINKNINQKENYEQIEVELPNSNQKQQEQKYSFKQYSYNKCQSRPYDTQYQGPCLYMESDEKNLHEIKFQNFNNKLEDFKDKQIEQEYKQMQQQINGSDIEQVNIDTQETLPNSSFENQNKLSNDENSQYDQIQFQQNVYQNQFGQKDNLKQYQNLSNSSSLQDILGLSQQDKKQLQKNKNNMDHQQGCINSVNNKMSKKLQFQHNQIFQERQKNQNYDNFQYNNNDYDQIFLENSKNLQQQKWTQFQKKLDNLLKQSDANLQRSYRKESLKSPNKVFHNKQSLVNEKQFQNQQFPNQKYLNEEIFEKQKYQQNDKQQNQNDIQIKEYKADKSVKLSYSIQKLQQKYSQNSNLNTHEDYKVQNNNKIQDQFKKYHQPLNQSCQIQVEEQIDYTNLSKQTTSRKTSCLLNKNDDIFSCGHQNYENTSNNQNNYQHLKYTYGKNLLSKSKASPKLINKAKNINLLSNIQENNDYNLKDNSNNSERIPCFFIPYKGGSNKIMLYFHGNSEDLGTCNDQMNLIVQQLKVNILAMEYPNYGVYEGVKPNEEHVLKDAEFLYEYLVYGLNIEQKNIIVMGRSLGTGPTIHLSSKYNPSSCILVSPFTSIRGVVKNYIVGGMLKYLINERFNNEQKMKAIKCPICFIHGIQDEEIPYQQSLSLIEKCQNISYLYLQENMTHKQFDMVSNILNPVKNFMLKCEIQIEQGKQYLDIFKKLQIQKDEQVCQKQQLLFELKSLNKNVLKIQA